MSDRYSVSLSRTAAKYWERCDEPTRRRLRQKLEKLKGRNEQRSARVGDLRILFQVLDDTIVIAAIAPRGEVYKHG